MRVAIIGGTGKLGRGLASALGRDYEVYIGSRDPAKAESAAKVARVRGGESHSVAELCDVAVLCIPPDAIPSLGTFERQLSDKLVVSPIVPMKVEGGVFYYREGQASAAEQVASVLKGSKISAALHTVPARFLTRPEGVDLDVLVAADKKETFERTAEIVRKLGKARPVYAGPLSMASSVERITPLLLNLAKLNGMKTPTVKFVD